MEKLGYKRGGEMEENNTFKELLDSYVKARGPMPLCFKDVRRFILSIIFDSGLDRGYSSKTIVALAGVVTDIVLLKRGMSESLYSPGDERYQQCVATVRRKAMDRSAVWLVPWHWSHLFFWRQWMLARKDAKALLSRLLDEHFPDISESAPW